MDVHTGARSRQRHRMSLPTAAAWLVLSALGVVLWPAPAEANSLGTYRDAFLARYPYAGYNNSASGSPGSACQTCHTASPPALTSYGLSFQAQPNHFTQPGINNALIAIEKLLTVQKAGTGAGTVTSAPAAVNCGGTCVVPYPPIAITPQTLSAAPAAGSVFAGWSGGGCAGTGNCVINSVLNNTTVTATFNAQVAQVAVTVNKAGTGTGTVTSAPAGISCGAACSAPFNSGSPVTLAAAAAPGSVFAGWSGPCTGTGNCIFSPSADTAVTATFNLPSFTLTVQTTGSGSGSVVSGPPGINCPGDCSEDYASGTSVNLIATASAGSTFTGWSGGGCSGSGGCTVSVTAATTVTAGFTLTPPQQATLTVQKAGTGTGSVTSAPPGISCGGDCTENYDVATSVGLTATASPGSTFAGWSGGGCSGTGGCTVALTTSTLVTATFNAQPGAGAGAVPVRGDFDGDGRDDLAIFNPADGSWTITDSSTGVTRVVGWGGPGDIPVPGDYDGDGRTDLAVWRPSDGAWFIVDSSTGTGRAVGWGAPGDIPVPGDYDGDGRTDLAVWRPSDGAWFIVDSGTGNGRVVGWGAPSDIPVPADYDGDGRTDVAVWRPSSGAWFIVDSSTGVGRGVGWGAPSDLPVPADYDGDGRADLAVWRPLPLQGDQEGVWFIVRSSDGGVIVHQWGAGSLGDKPIPLDTTGDGAAELAVFRTSSGHFFVTLP